MPRDDGDARSGGSVPDPENRMWRHPSELAAGAGTAPIASIEAGGPGLGSKTVAAIAVAAGAIYLSWYLAGSTSGPSVLSQSANQVVAATTMTVAPTTVAVQSSSPASTASNGPSSSTASYGSSSEDPPSESVSSTLTLGPLDDDDLTSYFGQPVGPLLKFSNRQATEQRQVGIYAHRTGREPLVRFVAYDGMLLTSASAIAGRSGLSLWDTDDWIAADVLAVDPVSDIAVLEPELWSEQLDGLAGTIDAEPSPLGLNQKVTVQPTTRGGLSEDNTDVDAGVVLGLGERVVHRGGHAVYEGARTTIGFRSSLAGGRLLDDRDRTVGMIINGSSWSLAAMPIESALGIAESLRTTGEPGTSWIGLAATTGNGGAARVVWIDPDGPSAEVMSRGDIIETWDGEPVLDADHLAHHVRLTPADREVEIRIRRQGRQDRTSLVPTPVTVND